MKAENEMDGIYRRAHERRAGDRAISVWCGVIIAAVLVIAVISDKHCVPPHCHTDVHYTPDRFNR